MKPLELTCKDVMAHICETLGEDLESQKCSEIKEHLDHCDNCGKYFHSVNNTISFYKEYNITVSDDCHDRLMKYLNLDDV